MSISKTRLSKDNLVFTLAAVCLSFLFIYFRFALTMYHGPATPYTLTQGTAYIPFQYRDLIPLLVRGLTHLFPNLEIINAYQLIEFAASLSLCFALRHYISFFIPNKLWVSLAALSVFYCLPFNFWPPPWYPWDMPSVLFFTLGLALLYRRNWRWYYPLFVIATFNRETTILLTLGMVVALFGNINERKLAGHVIAQFGLWVIIKLLLYYSYLHNPRLGYGLFEPQFLENLTRLSQWNKVFQFLTNWGFIWIPVLLGQTLIKEPFVRRLLILPLVCSLEFQTASG